MIVQRGFTQPPSYHTDLSRGLQSQGMRPEDADALNERIMHAVNERGEVFLSHTKVRDRYAIRLSVGNIRSTREHTMRAWALLLEAAAGAAITR